MKRHKGRVSHVPREEIRIQGDYAIVSQSEGRVSSKQIETAIMTMKRALPSDTRIITRIQGHLAVTQKPLEVRMGKGKGSIGRRVARVRINTVMFEIERTREGEPESKYLAGLRVVGTKLPVRYKIIRKGEKRIIEEKKGKEKERRGREVGKYPIAN
jgi:large subunit ribosomal protein L16